MKGMDYWKLLRPRYCFDRAAAKLWYLAPELPRPDREPALEDPSALRDIVILWPTRYAWSPGFRWVEPICAGLSRYVEVRRAAIAQLPGTAIEIRVVHKGREHKVAIDYTDKPDAISSQYLRNSLLYFKMQFRNGGYGDSRIVSGQYVPHGGLELYHHLPRLRRIRDAAASGEFDVYGRFTVQQGNQGGDVRARAVGLLSAQRSFRFQGGGRMLAPIRSLGEVARSKICIDLPGRGPFCFRLVEYLSIGACIVAYPHEAALCPPLVPGKHIAYCRPDLRDLVEICQHYLTHDEDRQAMIQASREYFDDYLHRDCIAAYYLERLAVALGLPLRATKRQKQHDATMGDAPLG
jgi:Glycosyl transferases group 1